MFSLKRIIRSIERNLWIGRLQRRSRNVHLGDGLRLKGLPIFAVAATAIVRVGRNATFTSNPEANLVGLMRKCTIAAEDGAVLEIGDDCGFSGVAIYCARRISIGHRLTCGANVSIWDTDFHPLDHRARQRNDRTLIKTADVNIGDDVFVGANSMILKGVTIGSRAIVAAGSIVSKSVPEEEIWGGNPIRPLRTSHVTPSVR